MTEFRVGKMYRTDGKTVTPPAAFLADKQSMRISVMMRDNAAGFTCKECGGLGRFVDASIKCMFCKGSGLVDANGVGIDPANTTTDHSSLSDADRRVLADAEMRARAVGHRPGWAIDSSPEGRAARQKTFDAMAEADEERENAWRNLSSNIVPPSIAADTDTTNNDLRRAQADHRTTDQIAKDHQLRMAEETRNYETSVANAYKTLR
jgi:hypothetical protein